MVRRSLSRISAAVALVGALSLAAACGGVPGARPGGQAEGTAAWEYPIHFGDPLAKVQGLLGEPEYVIGHEVYPASGVEVWYGPEDRVTKLCFYGAAAAQESSFRNMFPSDRRLMLGLTAHADEQAFRRALGAPQVEEKSDTSIRSELHCVWKTRGLLVDAVFLASDRADPGRTFAKGTLMWFYVSPAL